MNWQKLNEVETYTNLWNKFKGLFHKKNNKVDASSGSETNNDTESEPESKAKEATTTTNSNKELNDTIDLRDIAALLWKKKWKFAIGILLVGFLSAWYIFSVPRFYETSTTMAPEAEDPTAKGGTLSSIASSFGVDLSQGQSSDAITPTLYPDLMNDNKFVTDLFGIRVVTADNSVDTTYYSYLKNHQKTSFVDKEKNAITNALMNLIPKPKDQFKGNSNTSEFNPYYLSKDDNDIVDAIRGSISIDVDKKTGIISISAKAQDPLVCQTLADSVRSRLQNFIIAYRTSKARRDVEYYQNLANDARAQYEKTRRKYGQMADENLDVILESEKSKIEDVENTMQLQYNTYTAMNTQLEAARAKLRQYTPVFTIVQGAAVPIKPAGPKRIIFIIAWTFVAFFVMACWFSRKIILGKDKK